MDTYLQKLGDCSERTNWQSNNMINCGGNIDDDLEHPMVMKFIFRPYSLDPVVTCSLRLNPPACRMRIPSQRATRLQVSFLAPVRGLQRWRGMFATCLDRAKESFFFFLSSFSDPSDFSGKILKIDP
jgi:hypothetical protein